MNKIRIFTNQIFLMCLNFLSIKRNRWVLLVIGVLVLASVFLVWGCTRKNSQASMAQGGPEVAVVEVKTERIGLTTELPGRTTAYRVAEIRPQISGLIQKRLFTEGADVKAGDLLYQIDPAPFQAVLDNAVAALNRSEANLLPARARAQRFKELLGDKSVSQQDYDDAEGARRQAEADIKYWKAAADTARINLSYAQITSPISGRIGRSSITDGAIVTAYQPLALAVVQQLDPIYVDVTQSTGDLLRLQKRIEQGHLERNQNNQNTVRLILEDGTPYPVEGTLQFRDVSVDQSTGTVVLRTVFPNPDGILLPGMFVRALIKEGVNENAILIPQPCVSRDPKGNPQVVLVSNEGKAQVKGVKIDRAIDDKWLISSGLSVGDRVIIEGIQRVRPGAPVRAVPLLAEQKPSTPTENSK